MPWNDIGPEWNNSLSEFGAKSQHLMLVLFLKDFWLQYHRPYTIDLINQRFLVSYSEATISGAALVWINMCGIFSDINKTFNVLSFLFVSSERGCYAEKEVTLQHLPYGMYRFTHLPLFLTSELSLNFLPFVPCNTCPMVFLHLPIFLTSEPSLDYFLFVPCNICLMACTGSPFQVYSHPNFPETWSFPFVCFSFLLHYNLPMACTGSLQFP